LFDSKRWVSVAPTDLKFVTCAEDKVLKIWDLPRKVTESEKNGRTIDKYYQILVQKDMEMISRAVNGTLINL